MSIKNFYFFIAERNGERFMGLPLTFNPFYPDKQYPDYYRMGLTLNIKDLEGRYGKANMETTNIPTWKGDKIECTVTAVKCDTIQEPDAHNWRWLPAKRVHYHLLTNSDQISMEATKILKKYFHIVTKVEDRMQLEDKLHMFNEVLGIEPDTDIMRCHAKYRTLPDEVSRIEESDRPMKKAKLETDAKPDA